MRRTDKWVEEACEAHKGNDAWGVLLTIGLLVGGMCLGPRILSANLGQKQTQEQSRTTPGGTIAGVKPKTGAESSPRNRTKSKVRVDDLKVR